MSTRATIVEGVEYYTTLAAAKLLQVDPSYLTQRIRAGELTAIKVNIRGVMTGGRSWLYLLTAEELRTNPLAIRLIEKRHKQEAAVVEPKGKHRGVAAMAPAPDVASLHRDIKGLQAAISALTDAFTAPKPGLAAPAETADRSYLTKDDVNHG